MCGFPHFRAVSPERSFGVVAEYLELYLPNARMSCDGILARARRGAEQLTTEGISVRFLRSILVPQDETCFCLYEAASPAAVGEAGKRAGLEFERIVEAVQVPENRAAQLHQGSATATR